MEKGGKGPRENTRTEGEKGRKGERGKSEKRREEKPEKNPRKLSSRAINLTGWPFSSDAARLGETRVAALRGSRL